MTDQTPEARLAAALPCEDPEEPCDADGRDAHIWCSACIARHRIAADPTLAADLALAEKVRRFTDAIWWVMEGGPDGEPSSVCNSQGFEAKGDTLTAAIEAALAAKEASE